MAEPSIKGSVFSHCVEKLLKLISAGKISWDELPRHLEPGDITILGGPIHATQWYDIRIYERILLLNRDVGGDGSNAHRATDLYAGPAVPTHVDAHGDTDGDVDAYSSATYTDANTDVDAGSAPGLFTAPQGHLYQATTLSGG